jgi:hypothetical protein
MTAGAYEAMKQAFFPTTTNIPSEDNPRTIGVNKITCILPFTGVVYEFIEGSFFRA